MTYPQPSSNTAVKQGSNCFRLYTPMLSPGDIYESEVGAKAFALGPLSDLDIVNIGYFDQQASGFMSQAQVSAGRVFVAGINARNETQYAPSGIAGRTLFWSDVVFDPNAYQNPDIIGVLGETAIIKPRFDIIQYFTDVPSVGPARSDRTYYFESLRPANTTTPASNQGGLILPYYGRRYGTIRVKNIDAAGDFDLVVIGINFTRTAAVPATPADGLAAQIKTIHASSTVGAGTQADILIRDSVEGTFDAIGIGLLNSGGVDITWPVPINVRFSDTPAGG